MALREEFSYPSSDGRHQIHALRWLPEESGPRAVVQLVHGISEHMGPGTTALPPIWRITVSPWWAMII